MQSLLITCAAVATCACTGVIDTSGHEVLDESAGEAAYLPDVATGPAPFSAPAQVPSDGVAARDDAATEAALVPHAARSALLALDVEAESDSASERRSIASILWHDDIQKGEGALFGFDQIELEYPIGHSVRGSADVDLARVVSPDGDGFAMRHTANFGDDGARSQAGIWSRTNETFNALVTGENGIWIAQEWYFPEALSAGDQNGAGPWLNLWDWHSTNPNGGERWDTQPGMILASDGSMRVKWDWRAQNPSSAWSTRALPVGEWFDVEMHYVWTDAEQGATLSLWINGELALEQHGVKTKGSSHTAVETYLKFYGSSRHARPMWTPQPAVKYMRNVRMAGERIWR